jgi:hypothetical protein
MTTRKATIAFFANQNAARFGMYGIAGNFPMSVSACAWINCGHEIHHVNVLKECYDIK